MMNYSKFLSVAVIYGRREDLLSGIFIIVCLGVDAKVGSVTCNTNERSMSFNLGSVQIPEISIQV